MRPGKTGPIDSILRVVRPNKAPSAGPIHRPVAALRTIADFKTADAATVRDAIMEVRGFVADREGKLQPEVIFEIFDVIRHLEKSEFSKEVEPLLTALVATGSICLAPIAAIGAGVPGQAPEDECTFQLSAAMQAQLQITYSRDAQGRKVITDRTGREVKRGEPDSTSAQPDKAQDPADAWYYDSIPRPEARPTRMLREKPGLWAAVLRFFGIS